MIFTYSTYLYDTLLGNWSCILKNISYFNLNQPITEPLFPVHLTDIDLVCEGIRYHVMNSVRKRVTTTDRPVACLLSGGLDSSLICALVQREVDILYPGKKVESYCIGMKGSVDLHHAKIAADYIGTNHTTIE